MYAKRFCLSLAVCALVAVTAAPARAETITSIGSDTLEGLMEHWTAGFKAANPDISFDVEAKGSSTAPPALASGKSQLGPMSRKMKPAEISEFELAYGYKPTAIRVAIDALAVFVHKGNGVEGLTLAEVDAMFSSDRKCGHAEGISNWSQLGQADAGVTVMSRDSKSGTRGFFEKKALCKGKIAGGASEFGTSPELVKAVAADAGAVGYSGAGFSTSGVRAVPIAKRAGSDYVEASSENVANGSYPLARFLYIYVNKHPSEPLPAHVGAFVNWILSPEGQTVVADLGFTPLGEKTVAKQLQIAAL